MLRREHLIPIVALAFALAACSSDSDNSPAPAPNNPDPGSETRTPDLVMMTRIDETTGFMVAVNSLEDTEISNLNGAELHPFSGLIAHEGTVYTTGLTIDDTVTKWAYNGSTFIKDGEFMTGENARANDIIFVNDTKAYVTTYNSPELVIFNPVTMEKTGAIDLSPYALGGDSDTNPNASAGVIRDGKLFLGLAQVDTLETFYCQGGSSVLMIDVATDTVEKHLQDDRACMVGTLDTGARDIFMDELGDIYVNHLGSWGYYPDLTAGVLRIKAGTEEFDPDHFFSFTDLDLGDDVPGGKVSYMYRPRYVGDGIAYGNFWVKALSSNPPDYRKDKNYVAFKVDLRNQRLEKIDVPYTTGSSGSTVIHKDKVIFARNTDSGAGLFYYDPYSGTLMGDQTPTITSAGTPTFIESLD